MRDPPRLPRALWPRLQLVESTDLPGLPLPLRRWIGDYLRGILAATHLFAPAAPRIAELLREAGTACIVDLCSGGGGPWPGLALEVETSLGGPVRVLLTDLHPDAETWEFLRSTSGGAVEGLMEPVPADAVPAALAGVRTIFDGLHHLPPRAARAVLADAARRRVPFMAGEAVERSVLGLAGILISPLLVWLVTPVLRPLSLARVLLTYLLPVVPLLVLWDGIVSVLRCYRPGELLALAEGLDPAYSWSVEGGRRGRGPTLLVGRPIAPLDPPSLGRSAAALVKSRA